MSQRGKVLREHDVMDLSPAIRRYRLVSTVELPLKWYKSWRQGLKRGAAWQNMTLKMGRASAPRPPGKVLLVHCPAGLGELIVVRPVLDWIRAQWPAVSLVVAARDVYDWAQVARMLPAGSAVQCTPLDAPVTVRRYYAHWQPSLVLWVGRNPTLNFILESHRFAADHLVLWGDIGDTAYAEQRRFLPLCRAAYGSVQLVIARSDRGAQRYVEFGAANVQMLGDLRACAAPLSADPVALEGLRSAIGERPRWVAASTRNAECELAARLHRGLAARHAGLLTIIVPRYPETGPQVVRKLRAQGYKVAARSADEPLSAETEIYVADTFGELGLWYRLCPIAVVGGTFVRRGGHNPLEPARLGCAVLCGPDVRNVAALAADMVAAGALDRVANEAELAEALTALFASPDRLERARAAAREFARASAMTFDRVFDALRPHLDRAFANAGVGAAADRAQAHTPGSR